MAGVIRRGKVLHFNTMVDGQYLRFPVADFVVPRLKPDQKAPTTVREVERDWVGELIAAVKRGENPRRPPPAVRGAAAAVQGMTVSQFLDRFVERHYGQTKPKSMDSIKSRIKALKAGLGHLPLDVLNHREDIEAFTVVYGRGRSETSVNRAHQILRAAIKWGCAQNPPLLVNCPYGRYGIQIPTGREVKRERRLFQGEEALLLKHANGLMQDRIIGALETLCRQGEMLLIQNRHINTDRHEIIIPAANAKSGKLRNVPYHVNGRLAQIIKRRADLGPLAYLFGTERGARQLTIRKAWSCIRLKANGIKPVWVKTKKGTKLSKASQKAVKEIDLRWHDLRHEGASRLHALRVPLTAIQQMLGHGDLKTTQRYLNVTNEELAASLTPAWETQQRARLQMVK